MATIALQRLIDAVAAEKTEIASAVKFIQGVPQMIRDAVANAAAAGQTTEQAVNDLAAQLEVSTADLTGALAANTPSAPPAPPADPTAPTTSGEGTTAPAGTSGTQAAADPQNPPAT